MIRFKTGLIFLRLTFGLLTAESYTVSKKKKFYKNILYMAVTRIYLSNVLYLFIVKKKPKPILQFNFYTCIFCGGRAMAINS